MNWLLYAESIEQIEKLTPSDSIQTVDWGQTEWDFARKLEKPYSHHTPRVQRFN